MDHVRKSYRARYSEQLDLRHALGMYFAEIEVDDHQQYRRDNPSAAPGYMRETFKPVFWEYSRLVNDVKSRKLNLRALTKLMDSFSENLMSSGLYREEELSAFWAAVDDPQKIAIHSVRLKKMGASTLSRIVADADRAQRRPGRPGSQRPTTNRPTVPNNKL
jgi:hypothetical protein